VLKRDPRFLELEDKIWKLIEEEAGSLGIMATSPESQDGKDDASTPYSGAGMVGEYVPEWPKEKKPQP
jgi:hypothetical protein